MGEGAHQQVRWIADEGGRSPQVGGKDLRQEQRQGVDLENKGDFYCDRHHQQDDGHVRQKGREDSCSDDEENGHLPLTPTSQGIGAHGQPLQDPRAGGDGDHDHHGHEQEDDVEVNAMNGLLEREDEEILIQSAEGISDEEKHSRSQESDHGTMQLLRGDEDVGGEQDDGGDPEGGIVDVHQGEVQAGVKAVIPLGDLRGGDGPPGGGVGRHGRLHRDDRLWIRQVGYLFRAQWYADQKSPFLVCPPDLVFPSAGLQALTAHAHLQLSVGDTFAVGIAHIPGNSQQRLVFIGACCGQRP